MEQGIPEVDGLMTEAEYLRMEDLAATKHEFRNGSVIAMAGGTADHATIPISLGAEIRGRMKGRPCRVFGSDLRVRISATGNYYYPDLTVACEPLVFNPRKTEHDRKSQAGESLRHLPRSMTAVKNSMIIG